MTSAESILQKAAADGALDPADWPKTLGYILDRLDEVFNNFPKPITPPAAPSRPQNTLSSQESQATDKENAPPATPTRPPVPTFTAGADALNYPQDTINFYTSIRTALSTNFPKNPPHTIQRLAELVLEPKRRYRYLPPYLRALDRVVNVSSPTTIFPLPQAVLPTAGGLLNGTTATIAPQNPTLGSDESLGGALLTPIPWLQNRGSQNELISESTEIVEGPHGAGRIETVTVGMMNGGLNVSAPPTQPAPNNSQIASSHPEGETLPATGPVTQGEILRQEQEAGIVLNNPHSLTSHPARTTGGEAEGGTAVVDTVEGEEETPHARGPEIIGLEDTGPQKQTGGHLDIEGAVGRPSIERTSKSPGPAAPSEEQKDEEMKDEREAAEDGNQPKLQKEKADEDMKTDG